MAVLPILTLPDPRLRESCAPVDSFDLALSRLADDMLETMYAANGRGLAAPQVGAMVRLFVMDAGWKTGAPVPMVFVHPMIVAAAPEVAVTVESCLSIPGRPVRIARPREVRLAWNDLAGRDCVGTFTGFEAVCVQHERDHLDGVLCIDHPAVDDTVAGAQ